jgi:putative ABC transport system permease protein
LPSDFISVGWLQVGYAAGFVLVALVVSRLLRLGVEGDIIVGGVRAFAQLVLLGFILDVVFDVQNPWVTALVFLAMIVAGAGNAYLIDTPRRPSTFWLFTAVLTIVFVALTLPIGMWILAAKPWYQPQYIIPFGGMLIGNSVTAGLLVQRNLGKLLHDNLTIVETKLALGASARGASQPAVVEAVRTGMVPTITALLMVGLVHIPGIFGGQVLAGLPAIEAAKYQIVVMYMLTAGATLTAVGVAYARVRSFFTPRHQLRYKELARLR